MGARRPAPARPEPRAPAPVPRGRGGSSVDAGFTLVEVMAVVVVIVSTASVAVLIRALRVIRDNADGVMAASIARSGVDYLRTLGTTVIPIGLVVGAVPPGQCRARVDPRLLDPKVTIRSTSNWVAVSASARPSAHAVRELTRLSDGVVETVDMVRGSVTAALGDADGARLSEMLEAY